MVEFVPIDGVDGVLNWSHNRNEARARFQINKADCHPYSRSLQRQDVKLSLNNGNSEWDLAVQMQYGEITILVGCPSNLPASSCFQIKSRLSVIKIRSNSVLLEENRPEVIFNKPPEWKYLVRNHIIDATYYDPTITMELLVNIEEIIPSQEAQPSRLRELDGMRATICHLQRELAYFKEDEDMMKMFKEVLHLFKSRALQKFEHEMQLADDVTVHLRMIPITDRTSQTSQLGKSDRQATDVVKQQYEQRLKKLEAELTALRQRLDRVESTRSDTNFVLMNN